MDYFILVQDRRIAKPLDLSIIRNKLKSNEPISIILDVAQTNALNFTEYVDYMEKPSHIFSNSLKDLMEDYAQEINWRPIFVVTKDKELAYWTMDVEIREGLIEESKDKKIIVKKSLLEGEKIIGIKTSQIDSIIVVRLDLAESILRRSFNGVTVKKLEII